ncbi:hypothetical protein KSK37_01025 [Kaistella sp. DKR-2]|uniref:hypothetical protein n=1 Tax=Kaistella soli TaxID=2849654 RepID=UPI001C273875|nr:hypothetical protein [Kaistella soli]MBU8881657.1 hypothetical protein [Kaistella soli]
MKNPTVFDKSTFRLYIPFRKYLTLESILKEENVKFYIDFETPNSVTDFVRFYFEKKDEILVNQILSENEIEATDDFFVPADFKKEQKVFILYLKPLEYY